MYKLLTMRLIKLRNKKTTFILKLWFCSAHKALTTCFNTTLSTYTIAGTSSFYSTVLWVSLYDIFHAADLNCKLKLKYENVLDEWDPFEMLQVKSLKLLNIINRLIFLLFRLKFNLRSGLCKNYIRFKKFKTVLFFSIVLI